jgi:hypothetical protein
LADLEDLKKELASRAALVAGKDAAKRFAEDLLTSDEEKKAKEAASKSRRTKYLAYGVVGLLLVLGAVGLVLSYWQYFLLAGLLGVAGLYGYFRLRGRLGTSKAELETKELRVGEQAPKALAPKQSLTREARDAEIARAALAEEEAHLAELRAREEAAKMRALREEQRRADEQAIDDELSAMKARLKK